MLRSEHKFLLSGSPLKTRIWSGCGRLSLSMVTYIYQPGISSKDSISADRGGHRSIDKTIRETEFGVKGFRSWNYSLPELPGKRF